MYNNEDTILENSQKYNEDEGTVLEQNNEETSATDATSDNEATEPKEGKDKYKGLKHIALNGGIGFAVGTLGALLMGATHVPDQDHHEDHHEEHPVVPDTPVTTDGTLPVAHSVNDGMSFGQAFHAAHEEVGPGGVFEWHGQLYNTYTEEEWNSLSPSEQQEFTAHLKVVGTPDYESNVSHHKEVEHTTEAEVIGHDNNHDVSQDHTQETNGHEGNTDNVEVVSVDEPSVEVLGVQQVSTEDGGYMSMGGAIIDGQEVIVIDVNNDGMGDLMASDVNHDGQITDNEIVDISQDPITMSSFETGSSPATSENEIDYLS